MKYKVLDMIKEYLTGDWTGLEANDWMNKIEDELTKDKFYSDSAWEWTCGEIVEQSEPCIDREWYKFIDKELKDWYLEACKQVGEEPGL